MNSYTNTKKIHISSYKINNKSTMKEFQYNVAHLVTCIPDRRCMWNTPINIYNQPSQKSKEEIPSNMEYQSKEIASEERRWTKDSIIYKWTCIRDSFFRKLKEKLKPKRPFMREQLHFICKVIRKEPKKNNAMEQVGVEKSYEYKVLSDNDDDNAVKEKSIREVPRINEGAIKNADQSSHVSKNTGTVTPKGIILTPDSSLDDFHVHEEDCNEDEAFFASVLPTIEKYNDDDKLNFRMGVLAVMKKIKNRRKKTMPEHYHVVTS
nr:uncharacterized protein LOC128673879 [Plodia interpunctella]